MKVLNGITIIGSIVRTRDDGFETSKVRHRPDQRPADLRALVRVDGCLEEVEKARVKARTVRDRLTANASGLPAASKPCRPVRQHV